MKAATDAAGRIGIVVSYAFYRPGSGDPDDKTDGQERMLLRDAGIAIRYFGAATSRGEPQWNDIWEVAENLPELVEIVVTPPHGEARRVLLVPLRLRPAP